MINIQKLFDQLRSLQEDIRKLGPKRRKEANGSEAVTMRLIDAIELYSMMIKESDSKLLINFVTKTRLTQSAKLRIAENHTNVRDLVNEMKLHLLPTKSAAAIQTKLLTARQGNKTIKRYGQELEDLFVNLTLPQSNGKPEAYAILQLLNEK
jgi:hypothetical protein